MKLYASLLPGGSLFAIAFPAVAQQADSSQDIVVTGSYTLADKTHRATGLCLTVRETAQF